MRLIGSVDTQDGPIVLTVSGEIAILKQGADTITMNTAEAASVLEDLAFLGTLATKEKT